MNTFFDMFYSTSESFVVIAVEAETPDMLFQRIKIFYFLICYFRLVS